MVGSITRAIEKNCTPKAYDGISPVVQGDALNYTNQISIILKNFMVLQVLDIIIF